MNIVHIKARSVARKLRLHTVAARLLHAINPHQQTEKRVHDWLKGIVKPGHMVWDVGANVGDYTEEFCGWVGPKGRVVAFEPNPEVADKIKERLKDCPGLRIEKVALASSERSSTLVVEGGYTRSGHIAEGAVGIPILVTTGDAAAKRIGIPDIAKIDVEGFEEEVLLGFQNTLSSIRFVVIEVHFQLLESRGHAEAPIRIEQFLKSKGFKLRWIDRNHLAGERQQTRVVRRGRHDEFPQ